MVEITRKPILLLGASGTTGQTIARLLDSSGIELILAARKRQALEKLANSLHGEHRIETVEITANLADLVEKASLVINCVGPFTQYGTPVLEAAIKAGVSYLDITGEQAFIASTIAGFHARAKDNSLSILPSAAFEFALGDLAAAMLEDAFKSMEARLDKVEITYSFKNIATSKGTNSSVICALAAPSYHLEAGVLKEIKPGRGIENLPAYISFNLKDRSRFAFPGGEVFLVPLRNKSITSIKTYLTSPLDIPALVMLAKSARLLASKYPGALKPLINSSRQALEEEKQAGTSFQILAEGWSFSKPDCPKRLIIKGSNPYRLTAAIIKALSLALIEQGESAIRGVISPTLLLDHRVLKKLLEQYGVRFIEA
ncbi:hypothetical protein GC174_06255 [bacterium]|nr:hypothetical protein [bacterium]